MDFIPLSLIFFGAGLLAIVYYSVIPKADTLKVRLPNRVSPSAILLTLLIIGMGAYIIFSFKGLSRVSIILMFIFALLMFESLFLLLIRWISKNILAVLISLVITIAVFALYLNFPSFLFLNCLIIIITLGAAALLIKLRYLRTWMLFAVTILWVAYDFILVFIILPTVTKAVDIARPTFLYPAVTIGEVSLGSGDFMFLVLFSLILLHDFGKLPAVLLVTAQTVGLLLTGFFLPQSGFLVPFLAIMAPIFFLIYLVSFLSRQKLENRQV